MSILKCLAVCMLLINMVDTILCIQLANENKQDTSLMGGLICGLRCRRYPIKPDIRGRRCSLNPTHKTVRITRFVAKLQVLVHNMKTFFQASLVVRGYTVSFYHNHTLLSYQLFLIWHMGYQYQYQYRVSDFRL